MEWWVNLGMGEEERGEGWEEEMGGGDGRGMGEEEKGEGWERGQREEEREGEEGEES